ncbi:hypothetical protein [Paraburkholderia sediminicola]|uniref:hypothetical protein n=1 Tax=Paraburkholderia sediminicola TaxID=458836 RepID=UPI0038BDB63D
MTPANTGDIVQGTHPVLQALLDQHMPGQKFDKVLLVFAHPDDETMMLKTIWQLLMLGVKVHVIDVTQSNGGTGFTSKSGIQRPKFAATGKEELFSRLYGALRIGQTEGFLGDLTPNLDLLRIDVLSYPDRSPFNKPAERSIRYYQIADWNREEIVDFIVGRLVIGEYAAAISLRNERAVHAAHRESSSLFDDAIVEYENLPGSRAPLRISAVESGYYDPKDLRPIDPARAVRTNLTPDDVVAARELLARWFGRAPDHLPPNECEQPPGCKPQWDAERDHEDMEMALGTAPNAVAFLNAVVNAKLPISLAEWLAPRLAEEGASRQRPLALVHDPRIPAGSSSQGRRAEGVEPMRPSGWTRHSGPQTPAALMALPNEVLRARRGEGPQPYAMTDDDAEGLVAFKAPPKYVSAHVSLRDRVANLKSGRRRQGHGFIGGPRRDSVAYAVSPDQSPHHVVGDKGRALHLNSGTKVFASLDSAREYAVKLLREDPETDIGVFRLNGPANEIRAAIRKDTIDEQIVDRVAMILDENGTLHPATVANPDAKYRLQPGEQYAAPPVTGMPVKYKRLAAVQSVGKIAATAVTSYVSLRFGLGLSHEATMETMLQTGRIMFGVRAWINASKAILEKRLARLNEVAGSERAERAELAIAQSTEAQKPAGSVASPALDKLERRTTGMRGIMRGFTRQSRAEIQLLADVLRQAPTDEDAYRKIDELVSNGMFASDSVVERMRRVLWGLSYAPSDIAAAGIWMDPEIMLTPIDSLQHASEWLANFSTLMFVPVHLMGNGGQRLDRAIEKIGRKRDLDPTVPAAGESLPDYLPGNEHRLWARKLPFGKLLVYPRIRPDTGRMFRPPLFQRLPEFQMLGASIASVPFGAANAVAAAHSFMTGDVATGALQAGLVAADATFMRGFWHSYEDTHARNHGKGPVVRRSRFIPWIKPPLKGAEAEPRDITQPKLVDGGVLRGLDPNAVIGGGMVTQVVLNLFQSK